MAMADINVLFTRRLLSMAHALVKKHYPQIDLRTKDAWVYRYGRSQWEFHGPADFYWHGNADNAYEARYKGWMAWLAERGVSDNHDHDDGETA